MESKKNLFKSFFFFTQLCFGQFFYTGYQGNENNFSENDNFSKKDSISFWNLEKQRKNIEYKNIHHLGIFSSFKNYSNTNILQEKSDLIGNGFLTNYRFSYKGFYAVNSMFFTYDQNEARRGFIRTIKNVTMYTNQAYLKFKNSSNGFRYSLKIGRDFLIEGLGKSAKIFFSDFSRPFDQITVDANFNNFYTKISTINLEDIDDYSRYLYMHTLSYNFNKLNLTIGEAIISSGINESINIKYLNPISFWSWENVGNTDKGLNAFLYAGLLWKAKPSLNIYSEVLIDDINFHQRNAFFLNRYAYLIGIQKTSFPFALSNFWIESSNVIHQVYQSYHPSHIFTHRNYPIGHYLGNDFINHRIHYSQLLKSKLNKIFLEFSHLIKGQNNLDTAFDNPWDDENGNFNKNYKHPGFPTPPLKHIYDLHVGLEFRLKNLTYLNISFELQKDYSDDIYKKIRMRFWSYINFIK